MMQPPTNNNISTPPVISFSEAIDQLKMNLDILDVVGRRVELKKAGKNYSGLCPFHNEKTPSFNVSAEKQIFKCFGCGESGDVFAFLMKTENQSFGELIADLCQQHGINLEKRNAHQSPEEQNAQKEEQALILDVLKETAKFYRNQLDTPQGHEALSYLEGRNLTYGTQTNWMLGYAPSGWRNLLEALKTKIKDERLNETLLEKAGLMIRKETPENMTGQNQVSTYDRFRNRLMIPIWDEKGNVVAFGARALSDADQPKYLNSPETELYLKHKILYGLFQAKESIRKTQSCIMMEGYFDVLSTVDKGIENVVGICGTALSEQHLKLLRRCGAQTIYLCLDSDKAGQAAIYRTLEQLQAKAFEMQLDLKVMELPDGKDPDAFFQNHTKDDFLALLPKSIDGWGFQFNYQLKNVEALDTMGGRIEAASLIAPVLLRIEKPVLRYEWIRQLANQIGVSEESLHLEVKQLEQKSSSKNNSYYDKKNQSNQAISVFEERYTKNKAQNKRQKQKQLSALKVQEDVRSLRQHLSVKTTTNHKEAELISHMFLSTDTWDNFTTDLADYSFDCPLAEKLSVLLAKLNAWMKHNDLMASSVEERIQYLQRLMNQEVPESDYPQMSRYLSDRVFESEKLLMLYSSSKNHSSQGSKKYLAMVQLLLSNLQLTKQKQMLNSMVLQLKQAPQDQLNAVETLLHEKLQELVQQTKSAGNTSNGNEQTQGHIQPLYGFTQ